MTIRKTNKPRGKPFPKGTSGNPGGRPPGSRNRSLLLRDLITDDDSTTILEHVVASAKQGNLAAARFILDRVAPATSSPALSLDLPPIDTVDAGARAIDYLIQAVSRGEITLPEAKDMIELIKDRIKLIESVNFELRIQKVEQEIRDECLPLKFSTSVSPN